MWTYGVNVTRATTPYLVPGTAVRSNRDVVSDYRFSRLLLARLLGYFLALTGVAVFILTVVVAVAGLPLSVLIVGVGLSLLGIFAVGILFTRELNVVRLDDTGYRVRLVRGAGVRQARWRDVEDVIATTVGGERCVVLRLKDGRTTTVPVRVLAARSEGFVEDLQRHLNEGHGYRRIV